MNENQQNILTLIIEAFNAGTIALPVIVNAYTALKAEAGLTTDDSLADDTELLGAGLDGKVLKRLEELSAGS